MCQDLGRRLLAFENKIKSKNEHPNLTNVNMNVLNIYIYLKGHPHDTILLDEDGGAKI